MYLVSYVGKIPVTQYYAVTDKVYIFVTDANTS